MPFLAKMSAPFRSRAYSAKETQSKNIFTHNNDYYPSKQNHRLYNSKDKIVDYEDDYHQHHQHHNHHNNYDDNTVDTSLHEPANNGHSRKSKKEEKNDSVDYLYHNSREKFASWDIRDFENERNSAERKKSTSRNDKRCSRESSEDAEVAEIFVNGDSSSSSPTRNKRNGLSSREEEQRSSSVTRRTNTATTTVRDTPNRQQNGKSSRSGAKRSQEPWSEKEEEAADDGLLPNKFEIPAKNGGGGGGGGDRDQLLRDIENFGSLKKKNEKNAGLNLGFKAIVDKFRTKSDDKDKKELQKSKKQAYVDENWRYDNGNRNGHKERKSSEKFEAHPPRDTKIEKNHRIKDYDPDDDTRIRRSPHDDKDYNSHRPKSKHNDSDRSKRRSYAFEASPEDFDVRIQKYERVRCDDPDLHRRNSFNDKGFRDSETSHKISPKSRNGTNVVRKSSMKDKDRDQVKRNESVKSKPPKPKVSERHSRPLTPPRVQQPVVSAKPQENTVKERIKEPSTKKNFSMKEWYESNRQFAAKYLREHSKIKELSTSDVSARDEFIFGSPKDSNSLFLLENHDWSETRHHIREESFGSTDSTEEPKQHVGYREYSQSVSRLNETSSTKKKKNSLRSNDAEEDSMERNRRRVEEVGNGSGTHRRESVEDEEYDEDEEEEEEMEEKKKEEEEAVSRRSESYGRSFVMPTRKVWNYRDGV